jgi:hypothetical protein
MVPVLVEVLAPVLAVVAIGFAVARSVGVAPPALTVITYWVLGPAFVFELLAGAELAPEVVGKVVASTFLGMMIIAVVAMVVMRALGSDFSTTSATVLTSIHGNVGNFGLAISAFAFGVEALPVAGIVMVTVNTIGVLTGVGLATIRHRSPLRAIATAICSPLNIAVVPALAVNLSDAILPIWIERPVSLLAAAMIPVILLTLGIQIAGMPRAMPPRLVVVPIGIKLLLGPLAAFLAARAVNLGGLASQVVILQAAMPAAVFTSLVALEHDLEPDYVTSVMLTGTLVSVLTLPVVITLL